MRPVIAYVDDDISNLKFYSEILSNDFTVETYLRPVDLIEKLDSKDYDCFIVDIHMPIVDGFQLSDKIRQRPNLSLTPIFFITSHPQDELKITSFKKGGADFFDRLIKKDELVARIDARIKTHKKYSYILQLGSLKLDQQNIECILNDKKLVLTLIEFKILSKLLQIFPEKMTKDDLVNYIWGDETVNTNNLNSHLYNLRMKLSNWEYEISNHRFKGFWLNSKEG